MAIDMKKIGQKISQRMEELGFSNVSLAAEIKQKFPRMKTGKTNPSPWRWRRGIGLTFKNLNILSEVLKKPAAWFLEDSEGKIVTKPDPVDIANEEMIAKLRKATPEQKKVIMGILDLQRGNGSKHAPQIRRKKKTDGTPSPKRRTR